MGDSETVEMIDIPFTQYLMPDGRKEEVKIARSAGVAKKAQEIISAGYALECEMLSDYSTISLTICDDKEDLDIELCKNGPGIPEAVDNMILRFEIPRS